MSETKNYNETVLIPFLQRKIQELTTQNLILEANLVIERQKAADVQQELTNLQNELVESGLAEEEPSTPQETPKKKRKIKAEPEVLDASTY
jgi:hypothetical protein